MLSLLSQSTYAVFCCSWNCVIICLWHAQVFIFSQDMIGFIITIQIYIMQMEWLSGWEIKSMVM